VQGRRQDGLQEPQEQQAATLTGRRGQGQRGRLPLARATGTVAGAVNLSLPRAAWCAIVLSFVVSTPTDTIAESTAPDTGRASLVTTRVGDAESKPQVGAGETRLGRVEFGAERSERAATVRAGLRRQGHAQLTRGQLEVAA